MLFDNVTLPLFADTPNWQPQPAAPLLPAMPPDQAENFIWWCQHGNRDMCSAVLRKEFSMSAAEAKAVVMMYASPDCAHFARPIAGQELQA